MKETEEKKDSVNTKVCRKRIAKKTIKKLTRLGFEINDSLLIN